MDVDNGIAVPVNLRTSDLAGFVFTSSPESGELVIIHTPCLWTQAISTERITYSYPEQSCQGAHVPAVLIQMLYHRCPEEF